MTDESLMKAVRDGDVNQLGPLFEMSLFSGSVRVKAANRRDVLVRATHTGRATVFPREDPPPAGMRRLSRSRRGVNGEVQGNQLSFSVSPMTQADLEFEVPARTNLTVRVINGGAIEVEGVEGNLELNNVNGPIRLQGVSGSVVADAVNGDVAVVMTRVADQKVMAFSTLNGKLDVTLPRTTKANLKLRSDNGDVFTDFDVVEMAAPVSASASTRALATATSNRRIRRDPGFENRTVYGTINGGGPEIEARSFNGSVFIRRGPQ